jgi:hypothetical protein
MAAHLYRYGSELALLSDNIEGLKKYHDDAHLTLVLQGLRPKGGFKGVQAGFVEIKIQLSSISRFRGELQLKTDNILALVSYLNK